MAGRAAASEPSAESCQEPRHDDSAVVAMKAGMLTSISKLPSATSLRGRNLLYDGHNGDRRPLRFGALFCRAPLPAQIECTKDQTNVTISLREIA